MGSFIAQTMTQSVQCGRRGVRSAERRGVGGLGVVGCSQRGRRSPVRATARTRTRTSTRVRADTHTSVASVARADATVVDGAESPSGMPSGLVAARHSSTTSMVLSALALAMLGSLAEASVPGAASAGATDLALSIPGLVGDSPFREGFVSGFLLIFFSEIGDKTFFIALLLALQRPKSVVFVGTFGALAVMTVISVGLGRVLHEVDELFPDVGFPLDDALAVALLIFFGVSTLASASQANETAEEEKEEAQEVVDEFGKKEYEVAGLVASTFALVFAAEWGDKSFLATIALAAASDPLGVIGGAVTGHGVATVIAVLGGSFLGKYLSERTVQYVGGSLFLVFAAATLVDIFRGV